MAVEKKLRVLLASCLALAGMAHAQQKSVELPQVTVKQPRDAILSDAMPAAVGQNSTLGLESTSAGLRHIDQALIDDGLAAWSASNSLGLANGLSVRGFSVTNQGGSSLQVGRNFLNGHADLVWRFSRDPATLSRVQLISGSDATLLGAGSPAASVLYTSKTPQGVEFHKLGLALGSTGLKRFAVDAEWHWGPVQSRMALAVQRGDRGVEGVVDARNVLLLSNKVALGAGSARLDLEYHGTTLPFPFGTVYAGGKFWYDQPYVGAQASANRAYFRQAIYIDQPLGDNAQVSAYWQQGRSTRDEKLVGFFDPLNATQLRGYYRTIDERNAQSDLGLTMNGNLRTGFMTHNWTVAAQHLGLSRDFAGPQNIGGFTLNLVNPVFPVDLSGLALSPRYAFERYTESGVALADKVTLGSWEGRFGVRRSSFQLDSSTTLLKSPEPVATAQHTSTSFGAVKKINEAQRVWLSRATSFLPNRGRFTDGAFLPPSESSQWEAGWQLQNGSDSFSVAVFDLRQSNLPGRDPSDPDALVLIGSNRSQGLEVKADFKTGPVQWHAAVTRLHARIKDRVNAAQGDYLAGTPGAYGSLRASLPVSADLQAWARLQATTQRPGNDKASFSAPGYGVVSIGLKPNPSSRGLNWGATIENLGDVRYVRALTGADNVWQGARRSLQVWVELPL